MHHTNRFALSFIALMMFSIIATSAACAATASRKTIMVDGVNRSYLLYEPRNIDRDVDRNVDRGKRIPLVLVIHGGGGTARGLYWDTRDSFTRLADKHGFYIAYPNAVKRMWDFGAGKVSAALQVRVDDKKYFSDLIDHLTNSLPIDRRRVFATGISRGGQASYFLACQFPERIRAIAPITMPMPAFMADDCKATPDIGLALLNGTEDPIVPYDGGEIVVRRKQRGRVLSTTQTITNWLTRNGCKSKPTAISEIDPVADNTSVQRTDWTECDGAPVRLYRIEGAGHTWPSGSQYLPVRVVGEVTQDIDGAVEVWSFFATFR